jgi:glycerophosphoryl diester phosphodiesterase
VFTGHRRLESNSMETRPLLLGHRGARAEKTVTENTLAAFDLALADGCDGFEFDVRLSADGHAVICHDATTHGFTIAESSAQQLALPPLREILVRYQSTAFLDIELKVPGMETITADLLRKLPLRRFVVSSFLPDVLKVIRDLDVNIPLGLICETQAELSRWPQLPVEYVVPHHKLVKRNVIGEIKAAGKKILVWTVNATVDMKRFSKWGVDGIVSDHPKRLVRALGRQEKS